MRLSSQLLLSTQMEQDATVVLNHIVEASERGRGLMTNAHELAKLTRIAPGRLNDAVEFLAGNGYAELIRSIGSAPFTFMFAGPTTRGKYEYQRLKVQSKSAKPETERSSKVEMTVVRQPAPVGSPFGFTVHDWEFVERERKRQDRVKVVLGLQYDSKTYNPDQLIQNVKHTFEDAVNRYNAERGHIKVALDFKKLGAGYGEHQFNEIARDIIAADIAVFETSDNNTNVMIEMGVALTWGVRVLPIKLEGKEKPPSDISGQTWADYTHDGSNWPDPEHLEKLTEMISRAVRTKGSPQA